MALSVNTEGNCGIQSATKRNGFGHPILSLSHFSQSEAAPYDTRYQPIPNCSSVSLTHDYAKWVNGWQDRLDKLVRDYWDLRLLVLFPVTAALRYLFALARRFRLEGFGIRAAIHANPDLLSNVRALVIVCAVHAANCTLRPRLRGAQFSMISTNASAVKAPTPGCVLSRFASGHFSTSCSIAWLSSANRRDPLPGPFKSVCRKCAAGCADS